MTDTRTATYRQPGVVLTDHRFSVPLDHDEPDGERIELYGREVVAAEREGMPLPWLLYLQGGPGFGAHRLVGRPHWLGRALTEFRVLLLDQRGTGASTPVTTQVIEGFDSNGEPLLRAPKTDITTRQLLLHTAGFGYDFFN